MLMQRAQHQKYRMRWCCHRSTDWKQMTRTVTHNTLTKTACDESRAEAFAAWIALCVVQMSERGLGCLGSCIHLGRAHAFRRTLGGVGLGPCSTGC